MGARIARGRLFLAGVLGLAWISGAEAATFTVTKTADTADGACTAGDCSLREAIVAANASAGADTVIVPAGTYLLTIPGTNEDLGAQGDLDVMGNLTLTGAGAPSTIIDGSGLDRVIDVAAPAVTMSGITIRNGRAVDGAGLQNLGDLTLTDCAIGGNTASQDGGGIQNRGGTLAIRGSTLSGNAAGRDSGAIDNLQGTVTVIASTLAGNRSERHGGAITTYNGRLSVTTSTISGNTAAQDGGGIEILQDSLPALVTVIDSTVSGNSAGGTGGGIDNFQGQLSLIGSTVSGNNAGQDGGGIENVGGTTDVSSSTLSANSAAQGGGVDNEEGFLNLINTTLSANTANVGGAVRNAAGSFAAMRNATVAVNSAGQGAGISNQGSLTAGNSIVALNSPANCQGSLTSSGHNLADDGTCGLNGPGDLSNIADAGLAALADNGGATLTHNLLAGSPAIDAGSPAPAGGDPTACQADDQRGFIRPQGLACDIGAVERGFRVTKTADTNDGTCDEDCSLREAIDAAVASPGLYHVEVPAGTYVLTRSGRGEDANSTGDLDIGGDVVLRGAGSDLTIIDGNNADRLFHVLAGVSAELSGMTARNGNPGANAGGGGIDNRGTLVLERFAVSASTADLDGGGIDNRGTLTLSRSVIAGNAAANEGGGVQNSGTATLRETTVRGNQGRIGGGVHNRGTLAVGASTVSGNSASLRGGGISNGGTLTVASCTVSGNSAPFGGGIVNSESANVSNATIAGNASAQSGGGGLLGTATLANTILSANSPNNCDQAVVSNGHNLASDASCELSATGDRQNASAGLGALGYNGGATESHALLAGSLAFDAANPAAPGSRPGACEPNDQRGIARPQLDRCDVGAFELSCGDGTTDPGKLCREATSGSGSATTDTEGDGATVDDPFETAVTSPVAGAVSITEVAMLFDPLQVALRIAAPVATPSDPLIIEFRIDTSLSTGGIDERTFRVSREGSFAEDCTGATGVASPDPCVAKRTRIDKDAVITVLSSRAGDWLVTIPPVCEAAPLADCRSSGKSSLLLIDKANDGSDKLNWKWLSGAATTGEEFADPTASTTYGLCVYDQTGLVLDAVVPASEVLWQRLSDKGFRYEDPTARADGIASLQLKAGGEGRTKILVKGSGVNLPDRTVSQLTLPVRVQLVRRDRSVCFEDSYAVPLKNTPTLFKAKKQ